MIAPRQIAVGGERPRGAGSIPCGGSVADMGHVHLADQRPVGPRPSLDVDHAELKRRRSGLTTLT